MRWLTMRGKYMADFCRKCTDELFGEECTCNVAGLCKIFQITQILCEGCGKMIWVDYKGKKVF
jgi:hypothetical protein